MAHSLFGERFVGARVPAWHRLGTVIPEGEKISVQQALEIGKLDYQYVAAPIGYTLPDGTFVHSSDKQVILREPTADSPNWEEMGVVSDSYTFLQNQEIAAGLDALATATGWSFETVGALGKGETVFMTLRTGKRSIFGDDYDTYVICSDGRGNGRALQLVVATVRVVCQNTLLMSDSGHQTKISIPHDATVAGEFGFWLDLIGGLQLSQDQAFARLERLAAVTISDKQAKAIIARAYPMPDVSARRAMVDHLGGVEMLTAAGREMAEAKLTQSDDRYDWAVQFAQNRRASSFQLYQRFNAGDEEGAKGGRAVTAETLATLRQTPYAVVQAVSELVDWGGRDSDATAYQAVFGEGAKVKQRVLSAAAALIPN